MPNSPRLGWPYPSRGKDPWYDGFVDLVAAADASVYTTREDRNVVLMGGGTLNFVASSGVLSWSSAILLNASITGFLWSVPTGSAVLAEGEMLYASLTRAPTGNIELAVQVASQVPPTDAALMLAIRKDNRVYWRNGAVLADGDSADLFSSTAPPAAFELVHIAAFTTVTGVDGTLKAGQFPFDPTEWNASIFRLLVVLSVSDGALTGTAELYNLTDSEAVTDTSLATSSITPVKIESPGLTVGSASGDLKASEKIYEVRVSNSGSLGSEFTYLGNAYMKVEG